MKLADSRRLTGANLLLRGAGAVIDIESTLDEAREAAEAWRRQLPPLLEAVGWGDATIAARGHRGGAALAFSAPIDALYAATEVNEAAWEAAEAELAGRPGPKRAETVDRLRQTIAEERNPRLLALEAAAAERDVLFLWDDDEVSVGSGAGSITWKSSELPDPPDVPWEDVHEVPTTLVTGTNGKTTTARMLASILRAAGHATGVASTDGLFLDGENVDRGDYSGPGGARAVLRDRRVEAAVLETARGGLLRRGMSVPRADVGIVTNIADDHLGEYGIWTLDDLADVKFLVPRACRRVVANADDALCCSRAVELADDIGMPLAWFSLRPDAPHCRELLGHADGFAALEDGWLVFVREGAVERISHVEDLPAAVGGAAYHNVANALAAAAAAAWLDVSTETVRDGLVAFGRDADDNPGRLNLFELGGVRILVDFAHNPHGLRALLGMAARIPAKRRLVVLGQAGDRSDQDLRALAHAAWEGKPDKILLKDLDDYRRGRERGEVLRIFQDALREAGAPDEAVSVAPDEMAAVHAALEWAEEGDLLLVTAHANRAEVLDLMKRLEEEGWEPDA